MKGNDTDKRTLAICFGQFGPYHHARVAALQGAAQQSDDKTTGHRDHGWKVIPVQIAGATTTYEWTEPGGLASRPRAEPDGVVSPPQAEGLKTLCAGVEEAASPVEVFLKARKLFREEKVEVAFLPSYSPARYFALFAAAKSLGIRTVMMNESHAGTELAAGWRRWIKRQIVRRFDAALVGGEPHRRHFASLGIPADKIFTGYDAVDNALFAARADAVRSMEQGARSVEKERPEAAGAEREGRQDSGDRGQAEVGDRMSEAEATTFQSFSVSDFRKAYGLPERYFLSLGRMVEKKNLATLVAAYAKFCDGLRVTSGESARQAPVALVFVGSGELEGALREQARGLGLRVVERTDWKVNGREEPEALRPEIAQRQPQEGASLKAEKLNDGKAETTDGGDAAATKTRDSLPATRDEENRGTVFFYGFRQIEENPVFYALAEAFVLPSLKEEWGLVVNEAMACSLPVIVSRTAGCAEDLLPGSEQVAGGEWLVAGKDADDCKLMTDDSLEERSNGFVFDPRSSDALSEALRRIAVAGEKLKVKCNDLEQMGKKSREIVAKFSCENFARQALRAAEVAGA